MSFSSPVSIAANTTYVAAYFSSAGNYCDTNNYFTAAVTNSPLTALADGTDGSNGVYSYTTSPGFPTSTYMKSNYWVDPVFAAATTTTTTNIFTTQTPPTTLRNDGTAIELGVKFRSTSAGQINGVRFYKVTGNTGTHTGELYSSTGTRLAQATFTGETSSGWQTVMFSAPVAIAANTTYVATYFSSAGNYISSQLTGAITNAPLTALADGTDGHNGVYVYTSTPAFPTGVSSVAPQNYWVDVVYQASSGGVVANAGMNQTITLPTSSVTLNGSGSTGTITSYSWTKVSGPNSPTITTPSAVTTTVTGLIQGTYVFQLSVNGSTSTAQVTITVNPAGGGTGTTTITTTQISGSSPDFTYTPERGANQWSC